MTFNIPPPLFVRMCQVCSMDLGYIFSPNVFLIPL